MMYYYHNDHLSTPQKMTDASGVVVWSADYKPFGEAAVSPSSTITNNLRFPGQYYDAETGLHYNYFRDYNPLIGRYVERDPIGLKRGRNHLYNYTGNNALRRKDLFGLDYIFVDNCSGTAHYIDGDGFVWLSVPIRSGLPGVTDSKIKGRGPTPPGYYTVDQPTVTMSLDDQKGAYCDAYGNCWWAPYSPLFTTPNNRCLPKPKGTGRCGIHPDGPPSGTRPGTQGCTGIASDNSMDLRCLIDEFYSPSAENPLLIEVW